ncbi:MAG: helix-turn-helix transcriptional regulator [Clostridia bacterium]|nr:helix-turn-helix transcriptional regulator [Clostridia bacterium]
MSINETVGNHIRSLRKTRNITQEQLVGLIGDENISLSTLKRTENGNGGFNIEKLVLICKALNCELVDLFDEEQIKAMIKKYFLRDL